jgi:hypothetical protein
VIVPRAHELARAGLLWLCDGTQPSANLPTAGEFAGTARLPQPPWRGLRSQELEMLYTADAARPAVAGGAAAACVEVFDPLPAAQDLSLQSPDAMRSYASRYLSVLMNSAGRPLQLTTALRLRYNEPGLFTSTRDPDDGGRLLGLHVDSQEGRVVCERRHCRRFLSINVGSGPRSLLFVNQLLDEIAAPGAIATAPQLVEPANRNATDFARAWLDLHPRYPVLRVDIVPGGAYLAPVQNMIHDGSTLLTGARDWHVCAFGEFGDLGELGARISG